MEEEKRKNNAFIISNVPYGVVDLYFSTSEELQDVIVLLEDYIEETNKNISSYYVNRSDFRDIVVVIDEAHMYFDSRNFNVKWWNMERLTRVLTQCRKRNIKFYVVTQRLTNIDIRIRRLTEYIEEYTLSQFPFFRKFFKRVFGLPIQWVRRKVYENKWDIADIEADQTMKISNTMYDKTLKKEWLLYKEFFSPLTFWLHRFAKSFSSVKNLAKEQHNTYYVVGIPDWIKNYSLQKFMLDIRSIESVWDDMQFIESTPFKKNKLLSSKK